jgi:hypothetical protein
MTTYDKLLTALGDGCWHPRRELEELTVFPEDWLVELRREGHEVNEDGTGSVLVRLREPATA